MMAVISKSNNDSPLTSAQGLSKQSQVGRDTSFGMKHEKSFNVFNFVYL